MRTRKAENQVLVEGVDENPAHLPLKTAKSGSPVFKERAQPKMETKMPSHVKLGLRTNVNIRVHAKVITHQIAENFKKETAIEGNTASGGITPNETNPKHIQ